MLPVEKLQQKSWRAGSESSRARSDYCCDQNLIFYKFVNFDNFQKLIFNNYIIYILKFHKLRNLIFNI